MCVCVGLPLYPASFLPFFLLSLSLSSLSLSLSLSRSAQHNKNESKKNNCAFNGLTDATLANDNDLVWPKRLCVVRHAGKAAFLLLSLLSSS